MTFSVPPDLVPLHAEYEFSLGVLTVWYPAPLVAGAVDVRNWTIRAMNTPYMFASAVAVGSTVIAIGATPGMVAPGPDVVNYAATPADVIDSASGTPYPVLTDFPLAVL